VINSRIHSVARDLILIDTHYQNTQQAIGAYLLLGDRPALLETGPASTVETLLAGVRQAGVDPRDLHAIAVTHIHLDHAGAAGQLVRRFPHLDVYVHPVGAPHLIDPSRLLASARRLFGEPFDRLFGETLPVPEDRVRMLEDGASVELGSRRLTALNTPGHARHHHAYLDERSGDLFTGDVAGVAIPGVRFVRAPTPPPEFDLTAWHASLARIRTLRPRRLLLTHFGPHEWASELLAQLEARLLEMVDLARQMIEDGKDTEALTARLREDARRELERLVAEEKSLAQFEVIMPSYQSAAGLVRYITKTSPTPPSVPAPISPAPDP
jgi:glyoxylase-like metal-dependent hydrolase (beta-lactamase superfamily II)